MISIPSFRDPHHFVIHSFNLFFNKNSLIGEIAQLAWRGDRLLVKSIEETKENIR